MSSAGPEALDDEGTDRSIQWQLTSCRVLPTGKKSWPLGDDDDKKKNYAKGTSLT